MTDATQREYAIIGCCTAGFTTPQGTATFLDLLLVTLMSRDGRHRHIVLPPLRCVPEQQLRRVYNPLDAGMQSQKARRECVGGGISLLLLGQPLRLVATFEAGKLIQPDGD